MGKDISISSPWIKAFSQGAVMAGEGNMNPEGKVEKAFPSRNLYASLPQSR